MFDLTDDVENSPNTTRKVKPAEVKPNPKFDIPPTKKVEKKETPKNDANNEYEYSDDKEADDTKW